MYTSGIFPAGIPERLSKFEKRNLANSIYHTYYTYDPMDKRAGGVLWRGLVLAAGARIERFGWRLQHGAEHDAAIRKWLAGRLIEELPDAQFWIYKRVGDEHDDDSWAVDAESDYGVADQICRITPIIFEARDKFGIEVDQVGDYHEHYPNATKHGRRRVKA